ncbi:unnamed protein product [Brassica rapa subsp. trilocularis]
MRSLFFPSFLIRQISKCISSIYYRLGKTGQDLGRKLVKRHLQRLVKRLPAESSEEVHTVARSAVTTTVGGLTKEDIKTMLPEDKGPDVPADDSSSKDKAPEPNLVLLDKNQSTVSDLQKEDARYQDKRDAALVLCRANSDRTRRLAASQKSPYTANRIAKVIIPNKKLYPSYNPFAPIDKKKLKELADWLKTSAQDKKPRRS